MWGEVDSHQRSSTHHSQLSRLGIQCAFLIFIFYCYSTFIWTYNVTSVYVCMYFSRPSRLPVCMCVCMCFSKPSRLPVYIYTSLYSLYMYIYMYITAYCFFLLS